MRNECTANGPHPEHVAPLFAALPEGKTYTDFLNPDSLKIVEGALLEKSLAEASAAENIKHHRKGFYTSLAIGCEINRYLADVNKQAEELFDSLIKEFKQTEGITEQLKADNQLEWVGRMNNIRCRVTEFVNNELIYK